MAEAEHNDPTSPEREDQTKSNKKKLRKRKRPQKTEQKQEEEKNDANIDSAQTQTEDEGENQEDTNVNNNVSSGIMSTTNDQSYHDSRGSIQLRGTHSATPVKPPRSGSDTTKYYKYHHNIGHNSKDCWALKDKIEELI